MDVATHKTIPLFKAVKSSSDGCHYKLYVPHGLLPTSPQQHFSQVGGVGGADLRLAGVRQHHYWELVFFNWNVRARTRAGLREAVRSRGGGCGRCTSSEQDACNTNT